jgi:tripartite-type tricarboxylate transporter receptor subunit TctC
MNHSTLRNFIRGAGAALLLSGLIAGTPSAATAQDWPSKPIEIILPFPPGGGTDLVARALADALKPRLGVPVQVVNRAGGGGVVGFDVIRQAEPNGYTIGVLTAQVITANLRGVMKSTYRDFTPIAMINIDHGAIAVHPDTPFKTLKDLLDYAKANPGKLTLGNGGEGGSFHMLAKHLEKLADVKFKHVPFNGGPAANLQLLGHHIEAAVNGAVELLPLHKAGTVRVLAISGQKRLADFPDVPTAEELGYPIKIETWRAIGAPKGLAPEIVAKLDKAIGDAMNDPELKEKFAKIGAEIQYFGPQELAKYIASQEDTYKLVLKD